MDNVFHARTTQKVLERLEQLSQDTKPNWGKMNAAQMLAHLNVAYDMANDKLNVKSNPIRQMMLKWIVKPYVVGNKSYPHNTRTAPEFLVSANQDFQKEKEKLIANIKDVEQKGTNFFEGKKSKSFGKMTAQEWSQMFQKHLEHHFEQFGI